MNGSHLPLPAMRLGEIVLATGNYEVMKAWYRVMLDVEPSLEHAPTDDPRRDRGAVRLSRRACASSDCTPIIPTRT